MEYFALPSLSVIFILILLVRIYIFRWVLKLRILRRNTSQEMPAGH